MSARVVRILAFTFLKWRFFGRVSPFWENAMPSHLQIYWAIFSLNILIIYRFIVLSPRGNNVAAIMTCFWNTLILLIVNMIWGGFDFEWICFWWGEKLCSMENEMFKIDSNEELLPKHEPKSTNTWLCTVGRKFL